MSLLPRLDDAFLKEILKRGYALSINYGYGDANSVRMPAGDSTHDKQKIEYSFISDDKVYDVYCCRVKSNVGDLAMIAGTNLTFNLFFRDYILLSKLKNYNIDKVGVRAYHRRWCTCFMTEDLIESEIRKLDDVLKTISIETPVVDNPKMNDVEKNYSLEKSYLELFAS